MALLTHILITRFNVRSSVNVDRANSINWLQSRLEIFTLYCLPSITRQSTRPTIWLLLFDTETPPSVIDLAREAIEGLPFIIIQQLDVFDKNVAIDICRSYVGVDSGWLLTTRLDNDDALHPRYIETIQKSVSLGFREFLNISQGLVVANGKCYRKYDSSNAFITLSEPTVGYRTVWCDQHHRLKRQASVRQISLKDGWIQLVHGGNIANSIRGVRAPLSSIAEGVLPAGLIDSQSESRLEIILDNSFWLTARTIRSAFRYARTKIRDFFL